MSGLAGNRPLCDGGRCEQILTAIAKGQMLEDLDEKYAAGIVDVIRGVFRDLGIDYTDAEVAESVARNLRRVGAQQTR